MTEQVCDEIAEQIAAFCKSRKIDRKDALRYRLSAEECLLYWLENGSEGKRVRLRLGSRMLAPFILLEAEGIPLDPYRSESEDFGSYCSGVLTSLNLAPEYSDEQQKTTSLELPLRLAVFCAAFPCNSLRVLVKSQKDDNAP